MQASVVIPTDTVSLRDTNGNGPSSKPRKEILNHRPVGQGSWVATKKGYPSLRNNVLSLARNRIYNAVKFQ